MVAGSNQWQLRASNHEPLKFLKFPPLKMDITPQNLPSKFNFPHYQLLGVSQWQLRANIHKSPLHPSTLLSAPACLLVLLHDLHALLCSYIPSTRLPAPFMPSAPICTPSVPFYSSPCPSLHPLTALSWLSVLSTPLFTHLHLLCTHCAAFCCLYILLCCLAPFHAFLCFLCASFVPLCAHPYPCVPYHAPLCPLHPLYAICAHFMTCHSLPLSMSPPHISVPIYALHTASGSPCFPTPLCALSMSLFTLPCSLHA